MNKFSARSSSYELIDDPAVPFNDWEVCLKELDIVNARLGGHAITLEGVRRLTAGVKRRITVAEIGCGGGDNLKAINRNNGTDATYIGIDINRACTDFAEKNCRDIPDTLFICSDYRLVNFDERKPDIIFNSLFCHHFTDDELVQMMQWMKANSRLGFFINDLQRHPFAYYSIKLLTTLFSRSYLVRHDGPVSVLRGFRKNEWTTILKRAGITNYFIQWRWAFRYLIVVPNE